MELREIERQRGSDGTSGGIAVLLCASGPLAGQQRELVAGSAGMSAPALSKAATASDAKQTQGQIVATPPSPAQHEPEPCTCWSSSLLIHSQSRVKRMLTGNPAVIDAVLTSPTQVVVTAKDQARNTLLLWDENNQDRIVDIACDVDVASLSEAIERTFPGSGVEVRCGRQMILVGTAPSKQVAEQIVNGGQFH